MTEREQQHLLRCAIALILAPELEEIGGESRAEIAHKLEQLLALPFPSELKDAS
jgi:hypothetical protein